MAAIDHLNQTQFSGYKHPHLENLKQTARHAHAAMFMGEIKAAELAPKISTIYNAVHPMQILPPSE
jgi:hypothetical protein